MTTQTLARGASCAPTRHRSVATLVAQAFAARRQRRALVGLDTDQLDDLGLTRLEAKAEAKRPLWDVPTAWRR